MKIVVVTTSKQIFNTTIEKGPDSAATFRAYLNSATRQGYIVIGNRAVILANVDCVSYEE